MVMAKKSNREYWGNRLAEIAQNRFDISQPQMDKELKKLYSSASKRIQTQVEELYYQLLEDGKLSTTELYSYKRYIDLQGSINKELYKLGASEISILNPSLTQSLEEVFKQTMKEMSSGSVNFGLLNPMMAEQLVNSNWSGEHFSSRIWNNKNKTARVLKQGIEDCVINGTNKDKLVEHVKTTFGKGFKDADRIVRSELMHVLNEGQRQTYKARGYTNLEILVALDERTCPTCGAKDGKIIPIDSNEIPPIHARCRCTTIPVIPDDDTWIDERTTKDPLIGKKEKVWADTKYPEWYDDKTKGAEKVKEYEKELDEWLKAKKSVLKSNGSGIIEIGIDELSPCLRRVSDGAIIQTTVSKISPRKSQFKGWNFDWSIPEKKGYSVFAVKADGDDRIQGLLALKIDKPNYCMIIDVVESAPFNCKYKNKSPEYSGVGAHLFAEAVKQSYDNGFNGFVVFTAKTNLIKHYEKTLGATLINPRDSLMVIDEVAAKVLFSKYYGGVL